MRKGAEIAGNSRETPRTIPLLLVATKYLPPSVFGPKNHSPQRSMQNCVEAEFSLSGFWSKSRLWIFLWIFCLFLKGKRHKIKSPKKCTEKIQTPKTYLRRRPLWNCKTSRGKFPQRVFFHLWNPNSGPNSAKQILDFRISGLNS